MINHKKFKKQVVSSKLNFPLIDLAIFFPSSLSSIHLLNNLIKLKVPKYFFKNLLLLNNSFLIATLKFPLVLVLIKDTIKQFSILSKKLSFLFKIRSYLFISRFFLIFLYPFKLFKLLNFLLKKVNAFLTFGT
jgi:hypothetical protein